MRAILLAAIVAYQRYVSPYKGYCCAYRAHTGRQSCSALGLRAVRRLGVIAGVAVLRRRMYLCGVAHRRYAPPYNRHHRSQRGDCDFGCDVPGDLSCDLPAGKFWSSLCDCGGCDWPDSRKKRNDQEKYVYIPPRASGGPGNQPGRPAPKPTQTNAA